MPSREEALRERARRELEKRRTARGEWSPSAEADKIEKITGTGAFSAATGSGMSQGIPFADEIASGLNAPFRAGREWLQGEGFDVGRAYDRNMQVEAELERRRNDRHPIASVAGQVAAGTALGGTLAKGGATLLQGAKPTLPSLMGRGAAEGALYGGVYGLGQGRGIGDRAINAAVGAGIGGVTGAATGAIARIGAGKPASATPSIDDMQVAKNAAYDAADQLGVRYKPQSYQQLVADIVADAQSQQLNTTRHQRAASLIQDMVEQAKSGAAPTLRQLDEQRQIIYRDIGRDEAEQFFGNRIIAKIDDFIEKAQVGDALTGDPTKARDAVQAARELNRRYRNAQRVDEALIKAERRAASTNSGANEENAVRQNLRRILDNKSTSRFLNDAEKASIETVVRGTTGQNAARGAGNWLKGFGGHSLAGGSVVAAAMTGNPLPLLAAGVPYAAGSGLKAISRGMGSANERVAEALIRTGQMPQMTVSQARKAIADLLTRSGAQVLPRYIAP